MDKQIIKRYYDGMDKLLELAGQIPSQNEAGVKQLLYQYGQTLAHGAVVELGPWLGSITAHVATGMARAGHENPIYVYDRFYANDREVEKAERAGLKLALAQDTIEVFKQYMEPFGAKIFAKKGNLLDAKWVHGPIALYIDDAAKQEEIFKFCLKTFSPSFIPGITIVALLDFFYYQKTKKDSHKCQKRFMDKHKADYEFVCRVEGSSTGIFRYPGGSR